MTLAVLKGVSCPDHRSTLVELNQQGWDIQKTGSGHLKLTHEDAIKPVFSGSTVSDYRARKNLISECRNAIKLSRGTRHNAPGHETMSEMEIRNVLQSHKSAKKAKKRRGASGGFVPGIVGTANSENVSRMNTSGPRADTAIPACALTSARHLEKDDPQATLGKGTASHAKKDVKAERPEPTPVPDTPQSVVTPSGTAQDAATKSEEKEKHLEISTIDTKTAEKVTPSKTSSGPVKSTRPRSRVPATPSDARVTPIPADVLAIAQKIASGEYAQMQITEDMVGQTLFYKSDIMITQAKPVAPAAVAVQNVANIPDKISSGTTAEKKSLDKTNEKIISTIRDFDPESVTQRDLAELLFEELGFKNYESALASFSRRMTKLCDLGHITEEPKGHLRAFRIKA